jgi:hypothetical protein
MDSRQSWEALLSLALAFFSQIFWNYKAVLKNEKRAVMISLKKNFPLFQRRCAE